MSLDFPKVGWKYRALEMLLLGRALELSWPCSTGPDLLASVYPLICGRVSTLPDWAVRRGQSPTHQACPCESLAEALPRPGKHLVSAPPLFMAPSWLVSRGTPTFPKPQEQLAGPVHVQPGPRKVAQEGPWPEEAERCSRPLRPQQASWWPVLPASSTH